MKKIKVYNIGELVKKDLPDKRLYGFTTGIAIIEGSKGMLLFDEEAVGWKKDTLDDKVEIGLTDIPEENHFFVMAQYNANVTIKELMEAEYTEMSIIEFVERYKYNNRLKSNFAVILKTIDEIGLKSKDYYVEEVK